MVAIVAGVDEAGRGPLAGPVVAAAVVLDPQNPIEGLADSKKISEKKRAELFEKIKSQSLAWAVGRAEVDEIDELNILHATMLAMTRAVDALTMQPEKVLVDGNRCPRWDYQSEAIVGGDATVAAISAASIIAKVTRDNEMLTLAQDYPQYGLEKHKGYPTKAHLSALAEYGVSPIHRRSFAPVKKLAGNYPRDI